MIHVLWLTCLFASMFLYACVHLLRVHTYDDTLKTRWHKLWSTNLIDLSSREPQVVSVPVLLCINGDLWLSSKFVCLFVCLFVCWNKTRNTLLHLFVGAKQTPWPVGVITHGKRHKPRAYQRQRYKPRTCQSIMVASWRAGSHLWTYVGLHSDASSAAQRRPPMPCTTYWFWTGPG